MGETDPVHRTRLVEAWAVTRYQRVERIMRGHGRFSSAIQQYVLIPEGAGTFGLRNMDPPEHSRLGSLGSDAFTPRAAKGLRPRIAAIAVRLLDRVSGRNHFELVSTLAHPLPIMLLPQMLGVP